jgi:hypothetical protein
VADTKFILVQAKTNIPIPKVLDWSDDRSNAIGSEYIIMEHASGIQLHEKWPDMAGDQQVRCIDAIYRKIKEMVDLEFPAYGSLYLVNGQLESSSRQSLDEGFCIGPHCGTRYWDCNAAEPRYYHNTDPNHGPCTCTPLFKLFDIGNAFSQINLGTSLGAYCDGLIDAGLSRVLPADLGFDKRPIYHGSVQRHLDLLQKGRTVLKHMCEDPRIQGLATPMLLHPDLHKRNIFVSDDDPSVITAIIDWQSSSIEPAFWYADQVPDFAMPVESNEICAKTFEACTQFLTPKLSAPRLMDDALFRPFRYCYRTWKDGAVAFRHELIETSRCWTELGFTGSCPIPIPSLEELAVHQKEYKTFVAAQNLRRDLSNLLNTASDGWVRPEDWEETASAHREMFDGMLQAVLTNEEPDDDEPIREEGDLREIWPFDV